MTRRLIALVVGICAVFALGVGPAGASAASSSFTRGAGLLPKLKQLGGTKMRVVVPKIPCGAKTPDATITAGMFGSERDGSRERAWSVAVRVSCTRGHRTGRAQFGGRGGLHVRPGDVVVLTQKDADEYSIDDLTTGEGMGGATGTGGPGSSSPSPDVLFGGRLSGRLDKPVTVSVTNAVIHGRPFGAKKWVGQQQVRSHGKVVGDPGPLSKSGRKFPINFS